MNSYHNWGLTSAAEPLEVLSWSEDSVVEAIRHRERKVLGIMRHPERETPFQEEVVRIFRDFMG